MLLQIPNVLTPEQVAQARDALENAEWVDGRVTAGHQSSRAKNNHQLPERHPVARQLGDMILAALEQNNLFVSAALPYKVFPPLFNRYGEGQAFGTHVDNAIRQSGAATGLLIRTDLSATLFLSERAEYDGGELVVEDTYGTHQVKLAAGDMILYPANSLHHVRPVTRGERICSFFWIQSMIREDAERTLLFDLDAAIQSVVLDVPNHPGTIQLTGVYHNLVRRWAQV